MYHRVTPVLRSRLVAEQIIESIQKNKLSVGEKLPTEREMAASMNVSRNTLREAIAILQIAEILDVKQGSGIFVASIPGARPASAWLKGVGLKDHVDSETAIDARIALEPGVAILAASKADESDWEKLRHLLSEMEKALSISDIDAYRRNDNKLHRAIATSTHNRVIISVLFSLLDTAHQPLWYTIKKNIFTTEIMAESFREHVDIVDAISKGNPIRILETMDRHLKNSKKRLTIDID